MVNRCFVSLELSDTDRRALIVLLVLLVVLVLFIGLLGVAIRATMRHQAERGDTMMHDVAKTHVVDNPRAFRHFGFKKNNRALYRDSLIPFGIALLGLTIWIIFNIATGHWADNPWEHFGELFFHFDWDNSHYSPEEPLFVKVFGVVTIARWPNAIEGYPRFDVAHLCSYIEVFLWIVAILWYAYACQAYIARAVRIQRLSTSIYKKSLEGFNANADIEITPDKPLPPSD